MSELGASLKYFNGGDDTDHREYKRWKQWVTNKMNVMEKLPASARGSFVWTLLQGKALELVEHLKESDYQKEGGDKVLFEILDQRWPEVDKVDELGEHIGEIFSLKAREGETLRQWCARSREAFDKCQRKTGVQFPEEAKGWIMLNCGGLSEEQRAVILARAQGKLKAEQVAASMRSCFPDFTVPKRRSAGVMNVEAPVDEMLDEPKSGEAPDGGFHDVELFLADHHPGDPEEMSSDEIYDEKDVADVLAVSWKEKRKELAKLKQGRRFHAASDSKRSFRIEVEELKRRTKCNRCHQVGHWARECRNKPVNKHDSAGRSSSSTPQTASGASYVAEAPGPAMGAGVVAVESEPKEYFICAAECCRPEALRCTSMLDQLRKMRLEQRDPHPVMLISSPGYAVLDSGCGKTIIGEQTLAAFRGLWQEAGVAQPESTPEVSHFRFGNGHGETSVASVTMPIQLAGKAGRVKAAIIKGDAPLLLSRPAMKSLQAEMDFHRDELRLFGGQDSVKMETNQAGQYMVRVMPSEVLPVEVSSLPLPVGDETPADPQTEEPMPESEPSSPCAPPVQVVGKKGKSKDFWEVHAKDRLIVRVHVCPRREKFTPCNTGCPVDTSKLMPCRQTTCMTNVLAAPQVQEDVWTDPLVSHELMPFCWTGRTVFQLKPDALLPPGIDPDEIMFTQWTAKQHRSLCKQVRQAVEVASVESRCKRFDIVEVFSPPRFALEASTKGLKCMSADLVTGWDFRVPRHRDAMKDLLRRYPPELLILCPPCTWSGGWWWLNRLNMSSDQVAEKKRLTLMFVQFCIELIEIQISNGGRFLFEHPQGSLVWELPGMKNLRQRFFEVVLHMCQFGLRIPKGSFIQKATRLLISHADMKSLSRKCKHEHEHVVVAGHHPQVGSVSRFAGQYPRGFVRKVLELVPRFQQIETLTMVCESDRECLVASRVRELNDADREKMVTSLNKLHLNLGHPTNAQMIRILKHGGASQQAQDLARDLTCPQCQAAARPQPALPAQPERVSVFNQRVGIDVKYLSGWSPNQKIPAVNIVDYASSMQMMIPLNRKETSDAIRQAIQERWTSWAGQPSEIVCDPSNVNLSEALTVPNELAGSIIRVTAADAHYQLGKVEVHGGWFNRVLDKIIVDQNPNNRSAWMECVQAAHCKNELIQVYGMTPAQFVFGRNPRIAENLLDEPLEVVPATASLFEEEVARTVKIRQAARRAVLELQDDHALRRALAVRPRRHLDFAPGTYVAYWRTQKWQQGVLEKGGRWHGPAIVLGKVGRNHVIIHRKQILRCAPEQLRESTSEEKQLLRAPHAELLGIKQAFDTGQLQSQQYVDLVPQEYPTQESTVEDTAERNNDQKMPGCSMPSESARPVSQSVRERQEHEEHVHGSSSHDIETGEYPEDPEVRSRAKASNSSEPYDVHREAHTEHPPHETHTSYGPVRRRVTGKAGSLTIHRPAALQEEDFSEMMREVLPQLMNHLVPGQNTQTSPRSGGVKRAASAEPPEAAERQKARASNPDPDNDAVPADEVEALLCCSVQVPEMENPAVEQVVCEDGFVPALTEEEAHELGQQLCRGVPISVLLAQYHNKRASKEIPHTQQPPERQKKIDEAKLSEWMTIEGKNAGRLVLGHQAEEVRVKMPGRIMDSRFVVTEKQEEDAPIRVKARWCLLGHRDPDLSEKAAEGALQSPTLSQVGRSMLFQTIASMKWQLALGDIKGAFLAAGQLPARYRPLYARLPPGGIPGVPDDALIEVTGHVYGLNDSPSAWQKRLNSELIAAGFTPSRFDPCLYFLRNREGALTGIYGVHVDDCATGGHGPEYEQALQKLKSVFEFRKWRLGDGDFCGANYRQDPVSCEITMSQSKFVEKIRPMRLSRTRCQNKEALLSEKEISCLRAINGSLNWLCTQSRPDLSVQVSFSQQSFPSPTVSDALAANNAVRRAKQHAEQCIVYKSIPLSKIAVLCHSDAAYANTKGNATQGGYVVGFTHSDLDQGVTCDWTPAFWKSHRLPRVVNSTLCAEAQSMSTASSMCEWMSLMLTELRDGTACAQSLWQVERRPLCMMVTDCKSLFDHLKSPSAPSLDDRRTSIDIVIIREALRRTKASLRWIPTDRMLADSMTKENPDALDLLRACVRIGRYQISPEKNVLEWRASERSRRKTVAMQRGLEKPVPPQEG